MKKVLFLLLLTVASYGQKPSPSYNNTTTETLKIKSGATVTTAPFLTTTEADGTQNKIDPINLGFALDSNVLHKTGNETKSDILTIANQLNFDPITENSTNGYILKDGQPFIHNFYAGINPLQGGSGNNTNIGYNSGNFNADNFSYASTMVGFESGFSNKKGYSNVGVGYRNLYLNEDGFGNSALGTYVLGNLTIGKQNTSIGWHSMLYSITASENTAVGVEALWNNLTGLRNTALGMRAGASNTGNDNVFIGYNAGGAFTGSNSLYIANSIRTLIQGNFSGDGFLRLNGAGEFVVAPTRKIIFNNPTGVEASIGWVSDLNAPTNAYLDAFDYRIRTGGTTKLQIANNGDVTLTTKATAGVAASAANDLMRKGETDTALALKANLASPALTGTPTAPTAAVGTNTTQVATTAFVLANSRPYKVYTALLTQSGTSAPVATVLENTLGGTVTWSYVSVGQYRANLTGAFTLNKTACFITRQYTGFSATNVVYASRNSTNSVDVLVRNTTTEVDGVLDGATIEIRVYP